MELVHKLPDVAPKGYRPENSQAKELHGNLALWRVSLPTPPKKQGRTRP